MSILCMLSMVIFTSANAKADERYLRDCVSLHENVFLDVDMPAPRAFPDDLSQYKLSQLAFPKQKLEALIEKYAIQKSTAEHWELRTAPTSKGSPSLSYKEDDDVHGALYSSYTGMACPLNESDPQLVRAVSKVKLFLEELGVEHYMYPFYAVIYEHQFQISPRSTIQTQEDFLSSYFPEYRENLRADYEKKGLLGKPSIIVDVRFSLDGIPFAMQNTYDPDQDGVSGDGNAVPYALFTLSNDGKIVGMWVSRPFSIEKKQVLERKIYGWQEIVQTPHFASRIASMQQSGGSYVLVQVEPVYAMNKRGVTYPVWRFSLEWTKKEPMDDKISRDGPDKLIMDLYFDAITGKEI